jgi:hypothetical protein
LINLNFRGASALAIRAWWITSADVMYHSGLFDCIGRKEIFPGMPEVEFEAPISILMESHS